MSGTLMSKGAALSPIIGLCTLAAVLLLEPAAAAAEPDAHAEEGYRITVALRFADHAALTPLLADAVERQTSDQLRRLFGDLAQVRVVRQSPLIDRLGRTDLADFSLSLADFRSPEMFPNASETTFLFSLDYRGGLYQIAWRQVIRDLEQMGPLGISTTPDRAWLGKAVCLAVRDDFAPTALVVPTTEANKIELVFRGSQSRGWPLLQRWVTPGAVLQPYWVVLERDGELARTPIPFTLLRIEGQTGSHWAKVETNLPDPWRRGPRIVGFQAAKLPTLSGRVHLRLVDQATGAPVQAATVYASDRGFDSIEDADLLGSPDIRGEVSSARTFNRVAYIRVRQGAGSGIDFPLAITAAQCDFTCRLPVDGAAAKKGDFERELGYLVDDVRALQALLGERIRQINGANAGKRYEEAARIARALLSALDTQLREMKRDVGNISAEAKQLGQEKNARLSWLSQQLAEIERQQAGLSELAANLARTIEKGDAQARANVLIQLGNEALREGNIDDALDKYTLALGEQPDQPQLSQRLARLKQQWELKSPEHGASRKFVYEVWPGVELPALDAMLPEAERAFEQLEKNADRLTALKLLKVNEKHLASLDPLLAQLAGKNGDQDEAEHEKYAAVVERLAALQQRVAAFCEADMPQGVGLASEPARAETKSTPAQPTPAKPMPTKRAPAKPTPTKPMPAKAPESTAPKAKSPNGGDAPPKTPAKKPRPNSKPASPLDEEEPPLSRQSHRLQKTKNPGWVGRITAIENLRRNNIR
ncbi:MAG TPA: hypothetical protein VHB99_17885 [Pirellulales bacterium]|nr:hypothetical protein [Pirellulales bacterium]